MKTVSVWMLATLGLLAAGCSPSAAALRMFGNACTTDAQCASGMCGTEGVCTDTCSAAEPCPTRFVCGTAGVCQGACTAGDTQGSGATRTICVDGFFVACSSQDAIATCNRCGCEPFGGGMCLPGLGCLVPRADGESCTAHAECASGACYRDTSTCGAPRPQGDPCVVDADCETSNCSTDGDTTMTGVCNQPFESVCSTPGRTATCTNCLRYDFVLDPICARAGCGPEAPCPQLGVAERQWTCELTTSGTHACFERCTDGSYHCFDDGSFCGSNGFCG